MAEEAKLEEQKAKILKTLGMMLDYLGLSANLKIEERGENHLTVMIATEDAGRIIGRKGQTLEAMQLLLNRIMFKDDEECPRLSLDIDGYSRGERGTRREDGEAGAGEAGIGGDRRERRPRRPRGDFDDSHADKEQLEAQAQDAAKEVKRWGEPVTLPLMNAHDRRIIHMTLKDDPEVTTESEGEGAMKKVVISLKKAEN